MRASGKPALLRSYESSGALQHAMELLPDDDERDAVIDALAKLIADQGADTFIDSPIVEPNERFFPDPWEPSARGVRLLALRFIRYAGNQDLDAHVLEVEGGGPAALAAIADGICGFEVTTEGLKEKGKVVEELCMEVARAFREWTGMMSVDPEVEDPLVDLTAVYLGFGIIATNRAFRFRKEGGMAGAAAVTRWSTEFQGALSPQVMAFAFAVQVMARSCGAGERARLGEFLEPNQQDFFVASCESLAGHEKRLRKRLGVSARPSRVASGPLLIRLPPDAMFDPNDGVAAARKRERSGNVFMVRTRRFGIGGGFAGLAAAIVTGLVTRDGVVITLITILASVAGAAGCWHVYTDSCSNPECNGQLASFATTCPKCGGKIRGVISNESERLAAEEALADSEAASSTPYRD